MKMQEIKAALSGLLREIAQYDSHDRADEVRLWLMAATLRIWAANKLFSEDYVKALPAFNEREYTAAQVITALDCAGDASREMDVPAFFRNIAEEDLKHNTANSRSIADAIGRFLVLTAFVNGDFTVEEANALREISDLLLDHCDRQGVAEGKEREHRPEMVTPLNQTGYYQAAEEKAPSDDADTHEKREEEHAITPGTELLLYREPNNEHDEWAVAVHLSEHDKLGFISRFKNETIARLMDAGKRFIGVVEDPETDAAAKEIVEKELRRSRRAPTENMALAFSVYLIEEQ